MRGLWRSETKLLREFLRLSAADKWLLIEAVLLLEVIKLSMRLLPFRGVRGLSARVAGTPVRRARCANQASVDKVAWAVEAATRHTLGVKTCLNQALAMQVLLARRGHPALLYIGAARGEGGRFQAHAWVESRGVLFGGPELESFVPLAVLEEQGPKEFREQKL